MIINGFASDSGHWYAKDGTPAYTIIGKNGKERATTLRDARSNSLVPSVTTIIKCAAAPGLEVYKQRQILLAALTLPPIEGESEDSYIARIITDSKEHAKKAAENGTKIHGQLERHFLDGTHDIVYGDYVAGVVEAIHSHFGDQEWSAEKSFAYETNRQWYGGKVDLHSPEVVIDFKTKEFDKDNLPKPFDEHLMQLAAYGMGLKLEFPRIANVFVSTSVPGLVHIAEHTTDDHIKGWQMFEALLDYWYAKNEL